MRSNLTTASSSLSIRSRSTIPDPPKSWSTSGTSLADEEIASISASISSVSIIELSSMIKSSDSEVGPGCVENPCCLLPTNDGSWKLGRGFCQPLCGTTGGRRQSNGGIRRLINPRMKRTRVVFPFPVHRWWSKPCSAKPHEWPLTERHRAQFQACFPGKRSNLFLHQTCERFAINQTLKVFDNPLFGKIKLGRANISVSKAEFLLDRWLSPAFLPSKPSMHPQPLPAWYEALQRFFRLILDGEAGVSVLGLLLQHVGRGARSTFREFSRNPSYAHKYLHWQNQFRWPRSIGKDYFTRGLFIPKAA